MIRAVLALVLLFAGASLLPARAHGGHHHGHRHEAASAPVAGGQGMAAPVVLAGHSVVMTAMQPVRPGPPCHRPMQEGQSCCCATACVAVIVPPVLDLTIAAPRLRWRAEHPRAMQDFRRDPPRPPPRG